MGHHTLKGVVCDRPSILGMFRIENKIGYYRRLKSAVFNSDINNPRIIAIKTTPLIIIFLSIYWG